MQRGIPTSTTGFLNADAVNLANDVKTALENDSFKPPLLPEVAVRLTQIANKPNVELNEVEDTVRRDPVVAAKVLSAANSAFRSRGVPIESLRTAIMHIGLLEVRDVAFQVVVQTKLFRVPGYDDRMRQLANSAHLVGLIAKRICKTLGFAPDVAYLCGLLHDVGEALILAFVAEKSRILLKQPPPLKRLADALAAYHTRAGAKACQVWKLPESIAEAVLHHHDPHNSKFEPPIALIVAAAEQFEGEAGLREWEEVATPLDDRLARQLGLTKVQISDLRGYACSLAVRESEALPSKPTPTPTPAPRPTPTPAPTRKR